MFATSSSVAARKTAPLSRETVIDHALGVADTEGLAAVSIRRIAQDLGVTPMALYWHVKNKDELLAAMGDRILDTAALPPIDTAALPPIDTAALPPIDTAALPHPAADRGLGRLREILVALVDALRRHPACTLLAQNRILQCDSGRVLAEQALDVLRSNGFGVRQSADLARAALQTAVMLVSGRPGAETTVPRDERDAVLAAKRAALTGLPTDRFPHLVECASALTDCDDETAYYAAGIDLFLAGVDTLAGRQAVRH